MDAVIYCRNRLIYDDDAVMTDDCSCHCRKRCTCCVDGVITLVSMGTPWTSCKRNANEEAIDVDRK